MVATLAQMASAEYYLESQRSFRHPNEYYTAGEEPDGTWFNPHGLFGLADGAKIDSRDFHRLYNGFSPDGSGRLTRNAGSKARSPGLDMTFSVDKSVSALWAIAEPDMRAEIEGLAITAARAALEDTVLKYASYTRITRGGGIVPVPADLIAAVFPHGTSRENDPQLHIHTTILNVARTHEDGKYRAHHQHPAYGWSKAAGALFRAYLAWDLRQSLGVRMERYGRNGAYTRIPGLPEDLLSFWSKRRKAIIAKAGELGIPVRGNAARLTGVNKLTRTAKSPGKPHDNDPEVRHRRWRGEVEGFAERESLIASVTGHGVEIRQEELRALTEELDALPEYLAREEAVFRRPDMVEAAANRAAGLLGRDAVAAAIERVRRNPEIEALELPAATAESNAGMVHTERYSTRRNLGMEQAVRDMAEAMAADTVHALPAQAIEAKVEALLAGGYPLSEEQISAIRHATARGARVAVIEGAAGSGKTTTLRPITDLHREHGYEIVPTAVAWRTAVALGNDCEARPFCVDKLLKLAAHGQIGIGRNTLIVVDEAGMLSTRQAHHILRLSERHGAKIVFAGDTRQQQPVEAGPGLRLIRDVAGSVRVDRIRRQKADLEDVLVHVHGETPEAARFRAGLTPPGERERMLGAFEATADVEKPAFTPWQVTASEALRDGEAAAAIAMWHARGRFHVCHDEENTLTRLVEDWAKGVREEPGKSSIVLARTRAETRALSHLMRERHLAGNEDTGRVVVEVSRNAEDGRIVEPLEIAVGDRLRIGATQWEKQLFNGTVVTVEDIKVRRGGVANHPEGPSVLITARTDDGRRVKFRHDEIRDWYGNIRLDHGYALTIASAQGLTVDRAFLLADDRPARETIYPAATRHRDRLDIYVNRAPLALDIADSRADNDREVPVTDSEIRAYLAERWSRSQPKEAALDYITGGAWRDPRDEAAKRERHARAGEAPAKAANDNALARIARDIRRTARRWRHGQAVEAFAEGRSEVLAAYGELRERTRAEGDAAALGGEFRDTLSRHGALLKQAEAFRARPAEFVPLLAERGGIGPKDLDAFEALHARASRHRRAATMRHVHRVKREAEQAARTPQDGAAAPEARKHGIGQAAPPETPEQRERRAHEEALEFSRLRAAVYGARTDDEARTAREELDAYVRRETEKHRAGDERQIWAAREHGTGQPDTVAAASPAPEAISPPPARKRADEALARHSAGLGFAVDGKAGPVGADTPGVLSVLRRAAGRIAGGRDHHDRMETEMHARQVLERWEALKREWNRLLEQADREGVHVIYTDGYDNLYERLDTLSRNSLLDYDISSEMRAVLSKLDRAVSNRRYVDTWRGLMTGELDSREALEAEAAGCGVAVPDHKNYDAWRDLIDDAADRCREILAARHEYGVHLDDIARRGESLASALSRVREMLREDDRHLAATLVQQRKGEDVAKREKRIARLLDDPGKLRELRQKRAEKRAGKRQRRDRGMSLGMGM